MPHGPNEILYGWYSPTADNKCGHAVYLDMNGKEVLVSNVTRSPDDSGTLWEDIAKVGQLKAFVRAEWHESPYTKMFHQSRIYS